MWVYVNKTLRWGRVTSFENEKNKTDKIEFTAVCSDD